MQPRPVRPYNGAVAPTVDHPLRAALTNEVHARPFASIRTPARITHIAMLSGEGGFAADRAHLDRLLTAFRRPLAAADANHVFQDCGPFRLKWERHTEFCTWTVFVDGVAASPFASPAVEALPPDWLAGLPGSRLVAIHVAVERADAPSAVEDLARHFDPEFMTGSAVSGGGAEAWTDFRIHDDGYGRILVRDRALKPRQAGRLVQRLLEIETYRMMALLALPVAREVAPAISAADRELVAITAAMHSLGGLGDERRLLGKLTGLAAEVERITAQSSYRFGAARAYDALVERRIGELREQRIEGVQTIAEFMERRLAPALRTCAATAERLDAIAERLQRAGDLLRSRVDIALEAQNQALLASMDRRARLQLRLQGTVEGLSVAAISYYVVGLISYAAKALEMVGTPLHPEIATGFAIPVVVAAVWLLVRRVRRHIGDSSESTREL
ncbi:MAG TPA: DUF3422 domain-containing protein [Alphaproteobacteria bacterium]|nr:DUF3422 domain-containing protein [Alphaproteobacteria bacterium]